MWEVRLYIYKYIVGNILVRLYILRRRAKTTPDGENMRSGQRGKNTEKTTKKLQRADIKKSDSLLSPPSGVLL